MSDEIIQIMLKAQCRFRSLQLKQAPVYITQEQPDSEEGHLSLRHGVN